MLAALADGRSRLSNLAPGHDCHSTAGCLRALGVCITPDQADARIRQPGVLIDGVGTDGFTAPADTLDAGNSGTTARLLMGLLAAQPFAARLSGDASLQRRPMGRVIDPLALMGAQIVVTDGRLPATINGRPLRGITYVVPVPSAQVKSAILLAGLLAGGTTTVREPVRTRDHTELALRAFGARVETSPAGSISVTGGQRLTAVDATVPGDPSSAACWAVAAAALPGSEIEIQGVGLNPTRTAFFDVLQRFGALVEIGATTASLLEPVGDVRVRCGGVASVTIGPGEVAGLIDELPVLAALATHGGQLMVTGAAELRVKESDRISALVTGLRAMGGTIEEFPDGFRIDGSSRLRGGVVDAAGDHRLAMAFAIAALGARQDTTILDQRAVAVSYPGFFDVLKRVCV